MILPNQTSSFYENELPAPPMQQEESNTSDDAYEFRLKFLKEALCYIFTFGKKKRRHMMRLLEMMGKYSQKHKEPHDLIKQE